MVEVINQSMRRNQEKLVTTTDLRYRTASAVLRMLGSKSTGSSDNQSSDKEDVLATQAFADEVFDEEMVLITVCLYKVCLVYQSVL